MSLTDRRRLLCGLDERTDIAHPIAEQIVDLSLRECQLLDALFLKRNSVRVAATIKRRHKLFLAELLAYYCCVCEQFLNAVEGDIAWLVELITEDACVLATNDPFTMQVPSFLGDVAENRRHRYRRRIIQGRVALRNLSRESASAFLTARAALELRTLMKWDPTNLEDLSALESQLVKRLDWTARELVGG